jgi:hypothetical protein
VKRSGPPKRDQALVRKTPLTGRAAPLRRSEGLARGNGLARKVTPQNGFTRRRKIPPHVRKRAMTRTRGRCAVCRGRATQLHHVLPRRSFPEHEVDDRNLVPVCDGCHDEHERAHRRIPRAALPAIVLHFVMTQCAWYVERTYPARDWRRDTA